jgi:hypothetical protein
MAGIYYIHWHCDHACSRLARLRPCSLYVGDPDLLAFNSSLRCLLQCLASTTNTSNNIAAVCGTCKLIHLLKTLKMMVGFDRMEIVGKAHYQWNPNFVFLGLIVPIQCQKVANFDTVDCFDMRNDRRDGGRSMLRQVLFSGMDLRNSHSIFRIGDCRS